VVPAADGRALVEACRATPIDVVVSDVRMPRLDGLSAAAMVRREFNIPVVLMSGSWTAVEGHHAAAVAAVTLSKPFRPLDLLAAVSRAAADRPPVRRRVLIAQDEYDGLAERLAGAGYEVSVCPAAEAAAAAEITRPHLILVSAGAGGHWEAVRRVRQRAWGRAVRILAVGGWEECGRRAEATAAGCDGQLLRPVGPDEVACLLDDRVPTPA
jgi:CheY-like chemotaxis protein